MVKTEANDPELLLEALKAGHFYSSQGPELHNIRWEDNQLHVECSAAEVVIVQGKGSRTIRKLGRSINESFSRYIPVAAFRMAARHRY